MGKQFDDLFYGEAFLRQATSKGNARIKAIVYKKASYEINDYFSYICRTFCGDFVPELYKKLTPSSLYEYNKFLGRIYRAIKHNEGLYGAVDNAIIGIDNRRIGLYSDYESRKTLSMEKVTRGKKALIQHLKEKGKDISDDYKFDFEDDVIEEVEAHDNNLAIRKQAQKLARERAKQNKMTAPSKETREQSKVEFAEKTFVEAIEEDDEDYGPQMFTEEGYPLREKRTKRGVEYFTEFDQKHAYHGMVYDEERNDCKKV